MTFRPVRRLRNVAARFRDAIPWRPLGVFLHITLGFVLLTWGLATLSVWRGAAGIYVLYWVGLRYLGTIGLEGVYVLNGARLDTSDDTV